MCIRFLEKAIGNVQVVFSVLWIKCSTSFPFVFNVTFYWATEQACAWSKRKFVLLQTIFGLYLNARRTIFSLFSSLLCTREEKNLIKLPLLEFVQTLRGDEYAWKWFEVGTPECVNCRKRFPFFSSYDCLGGVTHVVILTINSFIKKRRKFSISMQVVCGIYVRYLCFDVLLDEMQRSYK